MAETSESLDFKKVKLPEKFLVITETIDFLNKKLTGGELPTVEEMAKAAIMPQSSFRRLFGEVMGLSPKQYAIATAIRYACFLLISMKSQHSEERSIRSRERRQKNLEIRVCNFKRFCTHFARFCIVKPAFF